MTRRTLLCALTLFVIAVSSTSVVVRGEQDTATILTDELAQEFKDKIVLLEVNRSSAVESDSDTVMIRDVRITKLGNRHFMVGIGYTPEDDKDYWYKDMLVGVPCDSILRFSAMTPEQCTKFMKQWKEALEE